MKRKIVAIMLAAVVVSASVVGCGENKTTETESKKVQTTTVATTKKTTSNHDAIKKYIEKADKIVIVKDAKNLDMEKAVSSMVSESQKDNVESVTVDDSKVDSTKAGTYPLTITVKLKDETADQKEETTTDNTKTESEVKTETSKADNKTETTVKDEVKDTKTETDAESKDTTTDNKQESEKNTIKDTVDVVVADKDKADDLLTNGSAVVGDDSKVEVKDDKEVASNDTKKEETDKKTEEKKEETPKKEETKKEETKKDTSSKTESSSSDKKQDNTTNTATPSQPAASKPAETKPAPSKPSTNTNSGSNQENSTPAPSKPAHQHNYVAQTHVVHHDATGHNEQYVVQAAWDEQVTTYEDYDWACCNVCGADITNCINEHTYQHAINYEGGGWHTEYGTRPVTTTVHHDAVYGTRWVQDSAAWDETVVDGYACSCGARQ